MLPPLHIQRLVHTRRDRLRTVPTPRRVQRLQMALHFLHIGREPKVLCDIRVVLRWVVPEGDKPDAEVIPRCEFSGLVDVFADQLDVLRRGGDVAALAARAVLDENEIPEYSSILCTP
jgi:hypothetical protein